MGGMLAARFATQFPKAVERLVIYNPIGLTDGRFEPADDSIDETYQQTLKTDYQSTRASLSRYVAHNPRPGTTTSSSTRASAIRGRSAPNGRASRWCNR